MVQSEGGDLLPFMDMKKNKFYAYVYLDPRKPGHYCYNDVCFLYEPIYVGKGCSKRRHSHLASLKTQGTTYFQNKLLNILKEFDKDDLKRYVLTIADGLSEAHAFDLEKKLITEIGRAGLKAGSLTNLTSGGDGAASYVFTNDIKRKISENVKRALTPEVRQKLRGQNNHNFGKPRSEETRRKISSRMRSDEVREKRKQTRLSRGYVHSEETKMKMSCSHLGKKHSEETRQKIASFRRAWSKATGYKVQVERGGDL